MEEEFQEIEPDAAAIVPTAAQVAGGVPVPPVSLLRVMSPDTWEDFTEEWLSFHRTQGTYHSIRKYRGPGDLGLDVVAFTSDEGFAAPWESFQCKHYDHPLEPNDIRGEVAKIIFHSFSKTPPFNQTYRVPRKHIFVSPQGVGVTVGRLLKDPARLKEDIRAKWDSYCVGKIGKAVSTPLSGELLDYFNAFDFAIFRDKTGAELIEEHAQTVFYAPRFGGGLPPRDEPMLPPAEPDEQESVYLRKLLDTYGDRLGQNVKDKSTLEKHPDFQRHYDRQRVLFYSAEALRNFARDRTPPRTFDSLQDDVYYGVIDVCEKTYPDSLERLKETVTAAGLLNVSGNALSGVTYVKDKQGICHQLANDDRLTWKAKDE